MAQILQVMMGLIYLYSIAVIKLKVITGFEMSF